MFYNRETKNFTKRVKALFDEAYRKRKQFGLSVADVAELRDLRKEIAHELKRWPKSRR